MEFVSCRKYQWSRERIFQPLPSSKCSPSKKTSHVVSMTGRQSYLDDWGVPFARVYPLCAHPLWRDAPNWALFRRWILKIYCEIALERRSGHHVSATGFFTAGVAVYLCFNKTSFIMWSANFVCLSFILPGELRMLLIYGYILVRVTNFSCWRAIM